MKKPLRLIVMIGKFYLYGFFLQVLFINLLHANSSSAQNSMDIKEVILSVDFEEVPLSKIFSSIQSQTNFSFFYENGIIAKTGAVSIDAKDRSLEEVLLLLARDYHLSFKQVNDRISVKEAVRLKDTRSIIIEQIITGTVTDANGDPLPGVTVSVSGTSIGTATDLEGKYTLSVPEGSTLVFSFIGFESQRIEVGSRTVIDVTLNEDMTSLDEVVVVGYGTERRSDLTGAITSVDGEELQKLAVPRIDQALQGQAAGVQISNVQNQPGGGVNIRIRGQNSITGDNNPLIVIDGILGGDIRMINPNDVASVDVLKDASATAIYGSRGSNGVIIITTKRGQTGAATVDVSSYMAMQEVRRFLPVLNAQQHRQLLEGFPADLQNQLGIPSLLQNIDPNADTDWQQEVFQTAPQHEHQVTVSGGTDKTRYAVMGNFFSQTGVVKSSGFERGSIRVNLDQEITKRLQLGLNLNLSRFRRDNLSLDTDGGPNVGVTTSALRFSPMMAPYDAEGNYSDNLDPSPLNNPLALVYDNPNITKRNFIQGAVFLDYQISEKLKFRSNLAYTNSDNLGQGYSSKAILAAAGVGSASLSQSSMQDWLIENTLTYSETFNDLHRVSVLGGFTVQGIQQFDFRTSGRGFSTEANNFYDISQAEIINSNSSFAEEKLASFLGRINYGFDNKYLLTVNVRADGSSKFATENKWAVFPSAALGWRMGDESFMEGVTAISNLKLRGSWGLVGSQAINPYQSLASLTTVPNVYSWGNNIDVVGVTAGRIPNPFLRWETTEQANIGFDLGLWKDRITISADAYKKTTRDLLYDRQLPRYTGYATQTDNIGSIENKGLEFSINSTNTIGEFQWSTIANLTINRNKVLSLGEDRFFTRNANTTMADYNSAVIVEVDEPLGSFFGYVFDGIYQTEEEVASIDHPGARPGAVKFRDVNQDGVINAADRVNLGDANPAFYYGITNNFVYKGWDLSIFVQGVQGGQILNLTNARLSLPGLSNSLVSSLDYWTGPGTSNVNPAAGETFGLMSDRFLEDASYLRVKNVMLGYTFSPSLLEKIKIRNLRIYMSAVNLLTLTKYSGFDPEVNAKGDNNVIMNLDHGGFPAVKTYTLGINFGL